VFRKLFVVRASVRASYALRRSLAVSLGLAERSLRPGVDWRDDGLFQRLLEGGATSHRVDEPDVEGLPAVGLSELLVASGWHRIANRSNGGIHRMVLARAAGRRVERLTLREFDASRLAALGWQSRRIGAELGVAAATVRGAIDRSVAKLRLVSSIQLPLVWHTLAAPCRRIQATGGNSYLVFERELALLTSAALTQAERSLVERLLLGESYRDIAAHRRVSGRTVANQMSRLYDRFAVSCRSELLAHLLASDTNPRAT
jgi:DNA-binding CsgD family transcriptional regulator